MVVNTEEVQPARIVVRHQSFVLRARIYIFAILFQAIHEGSKQIVEINSDDNRVCAIIVADLIERSLERLERCGLEHRENQSSLYALSTEENLDALLGNDTRTRSVYPFHARHAHGGVGGRFLDRFIRRGLQGESDGLPQVTGPRRGRSVAVADDFRMRPGCFRSFFGQKFGREQSAFTCRYRVTVPTLRVVAFERYALARASGFKSHLR
jgi:hypothetical protein